MTDDITPPPQAPEPASSSLTSRLINVFVAPGEVFAEVKNGPINHANWWVPAVLFMVASWMAGALIFSQPAIKQQLADVQERALQQHFQPYVDSGKMTQAQADQAKAQATKFAGMGQMAGVFISPIFQAAITPFWGGFILWLGGLLIFRQRFAYLKAVEVVGLTLGVLAVGAIVRGLFCTATGNMFASAGPVMFVKDFKPSNPLHTTLLTVDIFVVWGVMLRAVGLAKLGDTSFIKAAAWVLGVWIALTGSMLALGIGAQKLAGSITGNH
jgi:hypothetical protein